MFLRSIFVPDLFFFFSLDERLPLKMVKCFLGVENFVILMNVESILSV